MTDEVKSSDLIVEHLRQQDQNHRSVLGKLDTISERQNSHEKTLLRNTITVEEHVKGAIATNQRLTHVEDQLQGIQNHVSKIQWLMQILKPTRKKLLMLATAASLATGGSIGIDLASENPKTKKIIQILMKP